MKIKLVTNYQLESQY